MDQPEVRGQPDERGAIAQAQLAMNVMHVRIDRLAREAQLIEKTN
jgi:hypothetical protein